MEKEGGWCKKEKLVVTMMVEVGEGEYREQIKGTGRGEQGVESVWFKGE